MLGTGTQEDQTMTPMSASLEALRARARPIPMDAGARAAWADQFNAMPAMGAMDAQLDLSDPPLVRVHLSEVRAASPGRHGQRGGERRGDRRLVRRRPRAWPA
jgi:hypothetical protein